MNKAFSPNSADRFGQSYQIPSQDCSLWVLGKITDCCYPPDQIFPLDERSFGWSKRKSFCKSGMTGRAASVRAWRFLAKG